MRRIIVLLNLILLCSTTLMAGPGKIIVKGESENTVAYNSARRQGRICLAPKDEGKNRVITIPEHATNDLLCLISGDKVSFVRVKQDETVIVDLKSGNWKFAGDQKKVNNYLYKWSQQMFFDKPHTLAFTTRAMMLQLPEQWRTLPDVTQFTTSEYQAWIGSIKDVTLKELSKAKLEDTEFVREQEKRIEYSWLEMLIDNYYMAGYGGVKLPIPTGITALKFDDTAMIGYQGFNNILNGYISMLDEEGAINYTAANYIRERTARLQAPEIKEAYLLSELGNIIKGGKYTYLVDKNLESVKDLVVSAEGKKEFAELEEAYLALVNDPKSRDGKSLPRFSFEDRNDDQISSISLTGKFILIDIWATWCGPCTAQFPSLKKLEKEFRERDVNFLGISVDKPADKQKWLNMLDEFELEGKQVMSSDALNDDFFKYYGVSSIPRFILADPSGNVIASRSRRPSDPILKVQLTELSDQYDRQASWFIFENIPNTKISLIRSKGMSQTSISGDAKDGKLTIKTISAEPEFLTLSWIDEDGKRYYKQVYSIPGGRIKIRRIADGSIKFSGDGAGITQLIIDLQAKYNGRFPSSGREEPLDKKRADAYVGIYNDMVKDIEASNLSRQEKRVVEGYFQGSLLSNIYSIINASKVFGKAIPKPDIRKGYSDPVIKVDLLSEITSHSSWTDGVQEYLYAKLEAGKINIKGAHTYTADMASGLADTELQEKYIMHTFERDLLMGYIVGLEKRIEYTKPMVKSADNLKRLDDIIAQIATSEQAYKNALPGTDLSKFTFKDASGKDVALSDFKGKYIFIDLWSTGCNPCIGEIPYIKEMEHKFARKPIVWVSISTDMDEQVWKDFLVNEKMTGIQLLAEGGFRNPFLAQTGCRGIPHFLLLDKEGKVLDFKSIRPSNPILSRLIELELNKK